jgi:hypothetical protein
MVLFNSLEKISEHKKWLTLKLLFSKPHSLSLITFLLVCDFSQICTDISVENLKEVWWVFETHEMIINRRMVDAMFHFIFNGIKGLQGSSLFLTACFTLVSILLFCECSGPKGDGILANIAYSFFALCLYNCVCFQLGWVLSFCLLVHPIR